MAFGSSCGLPRSTAVKLSEVVRLNLSQMRYQTPGPFTRALTLADSGHRLCILGTSVEAMTEAGPRLQSPPSKFSVQVHGRRVGRNEVQQDCGSASERQRGMLRQV